MMSKKKRFENVALGSGRDGKAGAGRRTQAASHETPAPAKVSGCWLLGALAIAIGAAVFCAWCALCLLFWQGSWQLLYHPAATIARTPASAGLAFDAVGFATTDAGTPRLAGWWIAAAPDAKFSRLTVVYLHGPDGNLGDTVDALAQLHAAGVNVLAFDYRGYGQSQFVRPSEAHWREDVEWALQYLTGTRHVPPGAIVLDGTGLAANLALEEAAAHPELAGVIVEFPDAEPINPILSDPRARMVPARLLVRDRYDLNAAAAKVTIPVLWIDVVMHHEEARAGEQIRSRLMVVWIEPERDANQPIADALVRWLDDFQAR